MIERGDRRIVVQDLNGVAHFNAAFRNAVLLKKALLELGLPDEETRAFSRCMRRSSITSPSPAVRARSTSMRAWLHLLAHGFQAPSGSSGGA